MFGAGPRGIPTAERSPTRAATATTSAPPRAVGGSGGRTWWCPFGELDGDFRLIREGCARKWTSIEPGLPHFSKGGGRDCFTCACPKACVPQMVRRMVRACRAAPPASRSPPLPCAQNHRNPHETLCSLAKPTRTPGWRRERARLSSPAVQRPADGPPSPGPRGSRGARPAVALPPAVDCLANQPHEKQNNRPHPSALGPAFRAAQARAKAIAPPTPGAPAQVATDRE